MEICVSGVHLLTRDQARVSVKLDEILCTMDVDWTPQIHP